MRHSGVETGRLGGRSAPSAGGPSMRAILHIVFRRKWLIMLIFLVCASASSFALLYLSKPRYEAFAQLLLSSDGVRLPTEGRVPDSNVGPDERMARTIQLLTGRSLAELVVDAVGADVLYPDLAPHGFDADTLRMAAVARLMKNLSVHGGGRSSIISLGFEHEDPQMAARIPNMVGDLYVERYLGVERDPKADAFFEEQLTALREKLAESEQALEDFRRRHQISVALADERKLASADLAALRDNLAETRTRQAELRGQVEAINRKKAQDARIPRAYYQLKERLATLVAEEREVATTMTPEHPRLRNLREQIRGLEQKIEADGIVSAYGSVKEQEDFNVSLQLELSRIQADIEAAQVRQGALSARVDEARRRVASLASIDSEFNRLQTQRETDAEAYKLFLSKVQDVRMANTRDAEKVVGIRVIEEARVPGAPSGGRRRLKLALALAGSAAAAFGAAFVLQMLRGRVETGEEVERILGLPMLGSIPELRAK